jgi:hypothetical protein
MKTLKCIETVDKPRYRQFTISGNPGLFGKDKKDLYELHTLHTATCGQARIIGKNMEIWAWNVLGYCKD